MRILVVDDDAIARLIIEQNLKTLPQLSATIFKAENGKVAMDVVASEQLDVILLDLNMPIMNGFEVLEVLQEQSKTIPVYIVSSSNLSEDQSRCKEYPFVKGFFSKPVNQANLLSLSELLV